MSWFPLPTDRPDVDKPDLNQVYLDTLKGELTEEDARISLGGFLRYNIGFLVRMLTGMILYPDQRIIVKGWLQKNFSLTIAGRGWSKSWLFSHFCYLYCLLNPGRHVVMVSAQFRSSRKILENIDDWSRIKPDPDAKLMGGALLRQTMNGDMLKKPDKWVIKFKNGSTITAVPLGDPNRLRGLRANVLGVDEGLLIPQSTIDNVLKPFLFTPSESEVNRRQRVREKEDRLIKEGRMTEDQREAFKSENKMIVLSSASYSWEYLFELYKKYLGIIHGQQSAEEIAGYTGGTYLVHQLSWKVAPEDRVEKAIKQEIESGMYSETTIKREYEAQFVQDSDGFFRASKMKNCTIEDGQSPCVEIVGDPNAEYILGIDQSSSDSETSDHFAMCLLKIVERKLSDGTVRKIGMVVHQYAEAGDTPLKEHIEYLYYLLTSFKIVYMGYDASQGANLGFVNICNESELFREKKIHLDHVAADFGKEHSSEIIKQVQQNYNRTAGRFVQPQHFHSDFQRAANEHLQACFDGRNIVFAGKPRAHKASLDILLEKPIERILNVHSSFNAKSEDGNAVIGGPKDEFIVNQEVLMDLVKKECALIELKSNGLGHLSWDLPSHMKRAGKTRNKVRKDSYSALLLANWCLYIYTNAMNLPPPEGGLDWVPVLVGGRPY